MDILALLQSSLYKGHMIFANTTPLARQTKAVLHRSETYLDSFPVMIMPSADSPEM